MYTPLLSPHQCTNITEVRNEIDHIDAEIIRLLSTRSEYVREVVKYKDKTAQGIDAPERRAAVIDSRREWAKQAGLDPEVIGEIWDRLIRYFIDEEKKQIFNIPQ